MALSAIVAATVVAACGGDDAEDPPQPSPTEAAETSSTSSTTEAQTTTEAPDTPEAPEMPEAPKTPEAPEAAEEQEGPVAPSEVDPSASADELREQFNRQVAGVLSLEGLSQQQVRCGLRRLKSVDDETIRAAAEVFRESGEPPPEIVGLVNHAIEPCLE